MGIRTSGQIQRIWSLFAMPDLRVAQSLLAGLCQRAQAEAPAEIVGILGGHSDGRVSRDLPLPNASSDPSTFFADPYAQFFAERELTRLGEEVVALYHSHPSGDASFSALDRQFAAAWRCAHVVIGLQPRLEVRAYQLTASGVFVEVRLELLGEPDELV